jgi:sugar phosphate isomerase/epimerase
MDMPRRSLLAACAGAIPALAAPARAAREVPDPLGLVIHSYPVHQASERGRAADRPFADPIRFLDHCRALGVHSVQVGLGVRDAASIRALRDRAEASSMHVEGIVALPRDQADLDRFAAEAQTAQRCGAGIIRTVTLSGRRYETFDSESEFRKFADHALYALGLAARVVRRLNVRLAVENHKDWRADELLALLNKAGGSELGICLDTGNSIALLEDPKEVVETLAPRAWTTHFKDMGIEECESGFLLSEVPLGTGMLDLRRVVSLLRKARPEIRFNIEMITRDPLLVPCLTDRYWATFPQYPARGLARAITLVREHRPPRPLPRVSQLPIDERLRVEDENVGRCIAFARESLRL